MKKKPIKRVTFIKQNRGFTLLEVLVAMTIFSTAILILIEQSSQSLRQQAQLEEKTMSLWVAENQLASLRLMNSWPPVRQETFEKKMAQREWQIQQTVEETKHPALRKVTIDVTRLNSASSTTSLVGYLGEH